MATTVGPASAAVRPAPKPIAEKPPRLVSLDAYRGFIMTMLAASGFGFAKLAQLPADSSVWDFFHFDRLRQTGWPLCATIADIGTAFWNHETFQRLHFHFEHPAWESITGRMGVSFWDLIQPAFMFMVGVSMPYSDASRQKAGGSVAGRLWHAAVRAIVLTLMGVFLYSMRASQTHWDFNNVLAQIGMGYFFAWMLMMTGSRTAVLRGICVILVGYWGFFVMNPPPPDHDFAAVNASPDNGETYPRRYAAWSKNGNAAYFFDLWFLNALRQSDAVTHDTTAEGLTPIIAESAGVSEESADETTASSSTARLLDGLRNRVTAGGGLIRSWWFSETEPFQFSSGGYTTLNFVPSIATMLLGVLCGQLIRTSTSRTRTLLTLMAAAAGCLVLGILAHHTVCPIVKRIWTPSWVLFSGGYVIGMLALFYLLFDILPLRRLAFPLVVVGMNSLVMYLLGQLLRPWVTQQIVIKHFGGVLTTFCGQRALDTDNIGVVILPT
ncbi:MAG: hypothetical protein R3C49_00005, partial [Planctomycetaceae bacterium]